MTDKMENSFNKKLQVRGVLISYHRLCPRKAWWSLRGIWMEQESDTVALGRLLDETAYERDNKQIMLEAEAPDGTHLVGKIDRMKLKQGVLHETKKSRACEDAHRWQVRFYLWLLCLNGVKRADGQPFVGQLDYPLLKRTETVILEAAHIGELEQTVKAIRQLATEEAPPVAAVSKKFCQKCAYEELCFG
ncbi:MAG: CRISPR-associated protein Cas4 [Spirosomataceae bacterium]